ncbi:hypothetical protein [Micromonospora sp. DPT]|uniref:hypothetical protein n=1 Tax=Micromonospora sp. DPT TaxID=3142975 RepID=UPI00320B98DC
MPPEPRPLEIAKSHARMAWDIDDNALAMKVAATAQAHALIAVAEELDNLRASVDNLVANMEGFQRR